MCALDYTFWMGRPAVFAINVGGSSFPLYGTLITAVGPNVRIRIAGCLELEVPRGWIADIQADGPPKAQHLPTVGRGVSEHPDQK